MNVISPSTDLEHLNSRVIREAGALYEKLKVKLMSLGSCNDIDRGVFDGHAAPETVPDESRGRVDVSYAGVRIQFVLTVGIASGTAFGKVVCTHQDERSGELKAYLLGEFSLDERGVTNFVEMNGRPYFINQAPDLIIAYYLDKALTRNFSSEG